MKDSEPTTFKISLENSTPTYTDLNNCDFIGLESELYSPMALLEGKRIGEHKIDRI